MYLEQLQKIYDKASTNPSMAVSDEVKELITTLTDNAEKAKGVLAVIVTLILEKLINPSQDIRFHQKQLPNGFSGRSIDNKYVTPFLKANSFPAMAESGWLTRSLEKAEPYTLNYTGKIKPKGVKDAFLKLVDVVQEDKEKPENILEVIFFKLIALREKNKIILACPQSLSISQIIQLLRLHFNENYGTSGASHLPTLAIFAAYKCMMTEVSRFSQQSLQPLESHTASDLRTGCIGDIEIRNCIGIPVEGVEIKHNIVITPNMVTAAYEKFMPYATTRYYLLTTANMESADWENINKEIKKISRIHGCQVIVNGVYDSLKYYLRLLKDPAVFVRNYVDLLQNDHESKYEHKIKWNELVNTL